MERGVGEKPVAWRLKGSPFEIIHALLFFNVPVKNLRPGVLSLSLCLSPSSHPCVRARIIENYSQKKLGLFFFLKKKEVVVKTKEITGYQQKQKVK